MTRVNAQLEQEVYLMHDRICYALGDPKRVLILYSLVGGPKCVGELVEELGVPQPTVSRHLRVLRERGLATPERRGTAMYYSVSDSRIIQALDLLRDILASQLAASAEMAESWSRAEQDTA